MMNDQQGQPPQWVPQNPYQQPPYGQPPYGQPQYQSPSFYNQPTQVNSGQLQQSPYNSFQPPRKRTGLWGWYKSRTRKMKLGLGCGTILAVLLFFSCIGSAIGSGNLAPTPTPTATSGQAAVISSPTPTHIPSPTPVPTHKPTPTPTPKPTIAPTHAPQPTQPPPPQLFINFTCAQAVDYSYGRVCVHTLAGAALTITVTYCSGYPATSASLQGTVYANGSGNYEWDWTPETSCRGQATADVTAIWKGQSTSNTDDFNVQ